MTKVLNLDELETSLEKIITIKGVNYSMTPLSVEEFINQMKEMDAASSADATPTELYEMSLRMIRRAFPGLTDEVVRGLNTFQVDAIYAFVKQKADADVEEGTSAVASTEGDGSGND